MTKDKPAAIILAAGKSTRMKTELPKVLHPVCGRPMIEYVLDAAREAGARRTLVVVGYKAEQVQEALADQTTRPQNTLSPQPQAGETTATSVEFVLQAEQLGTGHAAMMCQPQLADHTGPVLILSGDMPLVRAESLAKLLEEQRRTRAACVIGTAVTDANEGLGRIVRDDDGEFLRIVEQKDATPQEAAIREINTGCYAFDGPSLFVALSRIRPDNQQAEYYLTDCPAILKSDGQPVFAVPTFDAVEALGVNTRDQLVQVERTMSNPGQP